MQTCLCQLNLFSNFPQGERLPPSLSHCLPSITLQLSILWCFSLFSLGSHVSHPLLFYLSIVLSVENFRYCCVCLVCLCQTGNWEEKDRGNLSLDYTLLQLETLLLDFFNVHLKSAAWCPCTVGALWYEISADESSRPQKTVKRTDVDPRTHSLIIKFISLGPKGKV